MENILSTVLFGIRVVLAVLAIIILLKCILSMRISRRSKRPLIMLENEISKQEMNIIYWENSIGRDKHSDIRIDDPTVSRDHAVLYRRDEGWMISDTNSKLGVKVNGVKIKSPKKVFVGDKITIGSTNLFLKTVQSSEYGDNYAVTENKNPKSTSILLLVSLFHILAMIQPFILNGGSEFEYLVPCSCFVLMCWIFLFVSKVIFRRVTFELEAMALFLTGLGIILISNSNLRQAYVQLAATVIGMILFFCIVKFIEKPDRVMKWRIFITIGAVLLFVVNLLLGKEVYGSKNWIILGPFSLQPSELIKIAFIFVGTSTLEKLQTKENLTGYIIFSCICIGCLFLMKDFGTACIFFVVFLVISFMRSGSIRTIILSCSAAAMGAFMILKFKPYVAGRFAVWGHVWEQASEAGYQQTRVLTYSASGGLFGVGVGFGKLHKIFAATSDLMFGVICEEMGLIVALTAALGIAYFAFYVRKQSNKSRSVLYFIAAGGAAGLMVFQASLNIFGATDILPLTGVTLPFISLGGSSLISVWGLLAFIKACDERTYALKR